MSKFPCASCKKECLAELVGTYLLVVLGPSTIIISSMIPTISVLESVVFIAFGFGASVGMVILLLGKYSGALINPAITFGATFAKILHSKYFLPYLFFQITGGLFAGLTLKVIFASAVPTVDLGSTKLAVGISPIFGVIIEAIGTFVLTTSALFASTRIKGARGQALLVGSTLFFLILIIGPITGASFNPARSIGPALVSGYFGNLDVYVIGPVIGAIIAGYVFRVIREHDRPTRNLVCLC
jgi:glycerol uptake facilitator-like aquaporin